MKTSLKISALTALSVLSVMSLVAPAPASAATQAIRHPASINGSYTFMSAASSGYLAITNGVTSGTLQINSPAAANLKDFQVQAQQDGDIELRSVASGLCLTPGASATVVTQPCGAASQRFSITHVNGLVMWINRSTGKVLTAQSSSLTSGVSVLLQDRTDHNVQLWHVRAASANRVEVFGRALVHQGPAFAANTTLRSTHTITASGNAARFAISNKFGTAPLKVDAASIAVQGTTTTGSTAATAATPIAAKFNGAKSVTIPAGSEIFTDPIDISLTAGQTVMLSLHLPEAVAESTYHYYGYNTTYFAYGSDATQATTGTPFTSSDTHTYFVKGIDVSSTGTRKALVAFGDSITDGVVTGVDKHQRWTDNLAVRLRANGAPAASVANAGIGANRILTSLEGPGGTAGTIRFDNDVVQRTGATGVFIYLGINDAMNGKSASEIIAGLSDLVNQARQADLSVNIATLTPIQGFSLASDANRKVRQDVNTWIRANSVGADNVVDFDAIIRDPANPEAMLPAYDSGDHIHPNATGFAAMANGIDLATLRY